MPLITGCAYNNPIALACPGVPAAAGAPALAPGQGDHLFGDVLGSIETAFQSIFGGGALWTTRMRNYNPTLHSVWTGLGTVDFGHGALPPVVQRNGAPEPDQHSHVFGGYSLRLQWQFCEIVCTGFAPGEVRRIGGATKAWKTAVLTSFDDLMNNLVDSTALAFYIATPNAIRQANPAVVNHSTLSLANAVAYTNGHNGPGKAQVQGILTSYANLRSSVNGLLDRLDGSTKTLNVATNAWT
jgi:hypothetical protein